MPKRRSQKKAEDELDYVPEPSTSKVEVQSTINQRPRRAIKHKFIKSANNSFFEEAPIKQPSPPPTPVDVTPPPAPSPAIVKPNRSLPKPALIPLVKRLENYTPTEDASLSDQSTSCDDKKHALQTKAAPRRQKKGVQRQPRRSFRQTRCSHSSESEPVSDPSPNPDEIESICVNVTETCETNGLDVIELVDEEPTYAEEVPSYAGEVIIEEPVDDTDSIEVIYMPDENSADETEAEAADIEIIEQSNSTSETMAFEEVVCDDDNETIIVVTTTADESDSMQSIVSTSTTIPKTTRRGRFAKVVSIEKPTVTERPISPELHEINENLDAVTIDPDRKQLDQCISIVTNSLQVIEIDQDVVNVEAATIPSVSSEEIVYCENDVGASDNDAKVYAMFVDLSKNNMALPETVVAESEDSAKEEESHQQFETFRPRRESTVIKSYAMRRKYKPRARRSSEDGTNRGSAADAENSSSTPDTDVGDVSLTADVTSIVDIACEDRHAQPIALSTIAVGGTVETTSINGAINATNVDESNISRIRGDLCLEKPASENDHSFDEYHLLGLSKFPRKYRNRRLHSMACDNRCRTLTDQESSAKLDSVNQMVKLAAESTAIQDIITLPGATQLTPPIVASVDNEVKKSRGRGRPRRNPQPIEISNVQSKIQPAQSEYSPLRRTRRSLTMVDRRDELPSLKSMQNERTEDSASENTYLESTDTDEILVGFDGEAPSVQLLHSEQIVTEQLEIYSDEFKEDQNKGVDQINPEEHTISFDSVPAEVEVVSSYTEPDNSLIVETIETESETVGLVETEDVEMTEAFEQRVDEDCVEETVLGSTQEQTPPVETTEEEVTPIENAVNALMVAELAEVTSKFDGNENELQIATQKVETIVLECMNEQTIVSEAPPGALDNIQDAEVVGLQGKQKTMT